MRLVIVALTTVCGTVSAQTMDTPPAHLHPLLEYITNDKTVDRYLLLISTFFVILTLLAYCLREFICPLIRRVKLRHPVRAWFVITSYDRYEVNHAVQDQDEHFTKELVVPAATENLLLPLLLRAKLNFTQYAIEISFQGDRQKKPLIHFWKNPFIQIGQSTKTPNETPGHYVDHHHNYHIDEIRHRPSNQWISYGFNMSTRAASFPF